MTGEEKKAKHVRDDFKRTAHGQMEMASHVWAKAWIYEGNIWQNACGPEKLIVSEWIYPWDVEEFDATVFEELRKTGLKHSFRYEYHKLYFRWSLK